MSSSPDRRAWQRFRVPPLVSDQPTSPSARGAVFLSYASQDTEAARRICEALRSTGVEVWFDQSELRGGDAWDQKIRRQIKECSLFMAVISANTNARPEGYFRLEWKLAVDRSHLMSDDHPFLFPVVIDDTPDASARVPDRFREVQWTRLNVKDTPESLATRVAKLLAPAGSAEPARETLRREENLPGRKSRDRWFSRAAMIFGLLVACVYGLRPLWTSHRPREAAARVAPSPASTATLSPARQVLAKARALSLDKYDSSADDFATAEGLLKQALALDENDAEIWAFSSLFNTSMRTRGFDHAPVRRERARRDAERALKLAPESPAALFALGRAQRDFEPAAAEATFKKILERKPDDTEALSNLAWICDHDGRTDEAATLYDRAFALDPAHGALNRYTSFLLFFHYGRFAEAERCIRQSVAIQPSTNSQGALAMLLLTWKGDADEAARVLATGPAATRNEPRTIWNTAFVHLCRRSPDEVMRAVDRLADDFIQDNWFAGPKAYFAGRAHLLAGRAEAARVAFEAALTVTNARLKNEPGSLFDRVMRGQLLAFLGQPDEALREARAVTELARDPRDEWYWFISPVLIYGALGRADDALPLLEKLCHPPPGQITGWPLTPALLRLDPLWDGIRNDPRFQRLAASDQPATAKAPAAPLSPARELAARARELIRVLDGTREDFALAEDLCERALKLDSTDGEVWAAASQLNGAFVYRGFDPSPERREKCRAMAERAIRLAPASTEAKLAQAGAWSTFNVNQRETEKLLREIVQERPNDQNALKFLAVTVLGRPGGLEECLALNERSAALPGGDALALYNNARYLWQRNRPVEAYATMQRSLAQKPFSSSLVFATVMEIGWRGDLAAAAATLQKIPPASLLEDRANYHAGLLAYYQRRPVDALRMWTSFPRDFYADFNYDGPKGYLTGLAYELDHRDAAARIEWRAALQAVEKRLATAANNAALLYHRTTLLACLGEKATAEENLRTLDQLLGFKNTDEAAMSPGQLLIYLRLGRTEEVMAHLPPSLAQSGTSGLWPARLRLDPRFDPLRNDPRFEKLLAQYPLPAGQAKK